MDQLLRKFYTGQIYIDMSFADKAQVALLEDIVKVRWSSGPQLSFYTQYYSSSTCFIYVNIFAPEHSDEFIQHRIGLSNMIVYKTHRPGESRQVIKLQDFLDHFYVTTLKPVTEAEIQILWG